MNPIRRTARRDVFTAFVLLLISLFPACAGGSGGAEDGGQPSCGTAEFAVVGQAGGQAVAVKLAVAGQALVNISGDTGCYLNLYPAGGGRLRLEWDDTLASGASAPATGSVNLEAQGGINLGSCSSSDKTSTITMLDDGVEFVLRDLAEAPYCSGNPVEGELAGCARFVD